MTLKIYMEPQFHTPDSAEGGIRRVVEALVRYLPDYGVEIVGEARKADLTAGHGVLYPLVAGLPFVCHNHGMYWEDYDWAHWAHQVNAEVVESMIRAQAITAPSRWVAHAITRGILRRPVTIYHGVDPLEWRHKFPHEGYVLWNKARVDPVSDPSPVGALARRMPDTRFLTTIGMPADNVTVTGIVPLPEMKPLIQRAGVYLATARETFGIGTLEALAAGVPVVGWNYGGQAEIILQGETGLLVPEGDYEALAEAVQFCLSKRKAMSHAAIEDVTARWQWPDKIQQYAELYQRVHREYYAERPAVSVVVTCHNLAHYLPACLDSILRQPFTDFEVVIVDDASTDETPKVSATYRKKDKRIRYVRSDENIKLSRALTLGANASRGRYIVNCDADNLLPEDALTECARELDDNPGLHIAYGTLDVMNKDAQERRHNNFPGQFNWRGQIAHLNQIHSSAMMRREVPQEVGGWRARFWRAEDAEFWTRATSFGFRARQVTETPTLIYRMRSDSKGALENKEHGGDGDWLVDFPFRMASHGREGFEKLQANAPIPNPQTVPFSAAAKPPGLEFWKVYHHAQPLISVIIPLGPGHESLVIDALDSLVAQDMVSWEALVINNTGHELTSIPGAPYAKIIQLEKVAQVGAARNAGARAAKGTFLYFLDADDYLRPGAFRLMLESYAAGKAGYIYSDYAEAWDSYETAYAVWQKSHDFVGTLAQFKEICKFQEQAQTVLIESEPHYQIVDIGTGKFTRRVFMPEYQQTEWKAQHSVNLLIAKTDFERADGFDETLAGWEDWDLFCKLAVEGVCGQRLAEPTWVYRIYTGTRRDDSLAKQPALLEIIRKRYARYYKADGVNMKSCCGGNSDAVLAAKQAIERANAGRDNFYLSMPAAPKFAPKSEPTTGIQTEPVRMQYIGENAGAITFKGKQGRQYRGGNNPKDRFINAHPDDVKILLNIGRWEVVRKAPPPAPEPEPPAPVAPPPDFGIILPEVEPNLFPNSPQVETPQAWPSPELVTTVNSDGSFQVEQATPAMTYQDVPIAEKEVKPKKTRKPKVKKK